MWTPILGKKSLHLLYGLEGKVSNRVARILGNVFRIMCMHAHVRRRGSSKAM